MNLTKRIKPSLLRHSLAALALATCSLISASAAVTWHDVQFGGFASQGYIVNNGNNDYLGETSKGSFDFREYAVNASYSIGKFRVGAQAFGQKLGDYGDDKIKLDWAVVDYQATQWFGIRAGRVKMPRGLYNEALDLDSVRPFVLLPQSVYDARLRDFNAAFNGGMVYGNISLHQSGSLDYRAFYGEIPMSVSSGANDYFNTSAPALNSKIGMDHAWGGSAFWNTPIQGLRVGYSFSEFKNLSTLRLVPGFAAKILKIAPDYDRHLLSGEYVHGDWVFAVEAGKENAAYGAGFEGVPAIFILDSESKYGYVSAARRLTSWLEVGSYFSYSLDTSTLTQIGVAVTPQPELRQKDYALSAKFDLNEHVIFKLEGHYMDGAGKIFDTLAHGQPLASRDNSWFVLAAKMTLSF